MLCAGGGLSALRVLATRGAADAIVSDLMMPVVDGFALLARIRALQDARTVPALALSGAAVELGPRALAAGFQAIESKPISPPKLVESVAALFSPAKD